MEMRLYFTIKISEDESKNLEQEPKSDAKNFRVLKHVQSIFDANK